MRPHRDRGRGWLSLLGQIDESLENDWSACSTSRCHLKLISNGAHVNSVKVLSRVQFCTVLIQFQGQTSWSILWWILERGREKFTALRYYIISLETVTGKRSELLHYYCICITLLTHLWTRLKDTFGGCLIKSSCTQRNQQDQHNDGVDTTSQCHLSVISIHGNFCYLRYPRKPYP